MGLQIVDGPIIEAGSSLSSGVDCTAGRLVRITTPLDWDSANLTFQISSDGTGYNDLFTASGEEVTVVVKGDNSAIIVDEKWTRAIGWLRIRSGSSKHPVAQKEGRLFALALEVEGAPASASVAAGGHTSGSHAGDPHERFGAHAAVAPPRPPRQ
jgi:hypothetical protein